MTGEEAIKWIDERMCCGRGTFTINHPPNFDEYWEAGRMAIEALQAEQTAEWIQPTSSEDCRRLDIRFVWCSKCGEQQIVVGHKGYNELPFNYCPNCRAKMSLQKSDEFTRSYSCAPDDYGTMCAWCKYNDGSKCVKPMKGDGLE